MPPPTLLELVQRAEKVVLEALKDSRPKSADDLEVLTRAQDPLLDREVTGIANLRLLKCNRIRLIRDPITRDYLFELIPDTIPTRR